MFLKIWYFFSLGLRIDENFLTHQNQDMKSYLGTPRLHRQTSSEYCNSLKFHKTSRSERSLFALKFSGTLHLKYYKPTHTHTHTHTYLHTLQLSLKKWLSLTERSIQRRLISILNVKVSSYFYHLSQMINFMERKLKVFSTFVLPSTLPQSFIYLFKLCLRQLYYLKIFLFWFYFNVTFI